MERGFDGALALLYGVTDSFTQLELAQQTQRRCSHFRGSTSDVYVDP